MEVAEVFTAQECVTIHSVVTKLSPVKCSKKNAKIKYFDGKLTDGKKTMRMVSFQPQLRSQLQASLDAATSVALSDCQVKEGGFQEELDIVAASRSKFLHQRNSSCHVISVALIPMQRRKCTSKSLTTWR